MSLVETKINLLNKEILNFGHSPIEFCFSVAGIEVRYLLYGTHQSVMAQNLGEYFRDFPSSKKKPTVNLHYYAPNNEFQDVNHTIWNDDDWFIHTQNLDNRKYISQRDFVAFQDKFSDDLYAIGPILGEECCNSIDNLVQFALSKHLINKSILPLHCATIVDNELAYVFYGESGAGKSTLAMQSINLENLQILGGDQLFLKIDSQQILAFPNSTTISDIPRTHPAWAGRVYPVKAITHLKKFPRIYDYKRLSFEASLPLILRETISWPEGLSAHSLLELVLKLGENQNVLFGEMSYKKGETFWQKFKQELV